MMGKQTLPMLKFPKRKIERKTSDVSIQQGVHPRNYLIKKKGLKAPLYVFDFYPK